MSKSYCGLGKIPKGHKRGSMKDCVMAGQVRYYGIKKVDPRLLESRLKLQKEDTRESLLIKIAGLKGRINKLRRYKDAIKVSVAKKSDLEKRKKIINEIKKIRQNISALQVKLRKISRKPKKRKIRKRKTSRKKTSKKKKRKISKRKTSRRKPSKKKKSKKRKHKGGSCGKMHKKRKTKRKPSRKKTSKKKRVVKRKKASSKKKTKKRITKKRRISKRKSSKKRKVKRKSSRRTSKK